MGPSIKARALDNRLGVATLLELVKNEYPNIDLLAVFSVQEEVGGRGAQAAAFALEPDIALALDSTPAYDLPLPESENDPQLENTQFNVRLDAGPAIYVADSGTLSDPRLVRFLLQTAEEAEIPCQLRQPGSGGTDAGAMHRQRAGIPSVSVSVPGRYHHSPASIARISDWQNTLALLDAALQAVTPGLLEPDRA
jgi:endoglucanase